MQGGGRGEEGRRERVKAEGREEGRERVEGYK